MLQLHFGHPLFCQPCFIFISTLKIKQGWHNKGWPMWSCNPSLYCWQLHNFYNGLTARQPKAAISHCSLVSGVNAIVGLTSESSPGCSKLIWYVFSKYWCKVWDLLLKEDSRLLIINIASNRTEIKIDTSKSQTHNYLIALKYWIFNKYNKRILCVLVTHSMKSSCTQLTLLNLILEAVVCSCHPLQCFIFLN